MKTWPDCPYSRPNRRDQINAIMEYEEYQINSVSQRRDQTHASIYVPNFKSLAVLDTGASISIIRPELAKKIHPTTATLRDITGQRIPVMGITEAILSLPRRARIRQIFLVADIPHSLIILGSDFMRNNKLCLNFLSNKLYNTQTRTSIQYKTPPRPSVAATQYNNPSRPANSDSSDRKRKNIGYFVVERNTSIPFLVDSGAMKSIIAKEFLTPTSRNHHTLFSLSNCPLNAAGKITLDVDIGMKRAFSHSFIVVENSVTQAVLGLDFLRKFKLTVDCDHNRIIGPNTEASMAYGCWPSIELETIFHTWTDEINKAQTVKSLSTWRACRQNPQLIRTAENINIIHTAQQGEFSLPEEKFIAQCERQLDMVPRCLATPNYFHKPKHNISLDIALTKPTPINHKPRPCQPTLRTFVRDSLQDMMNRNILQRDSPSHVSPITLVPKKKWKNQDLCGLHEIKWFHGRHQLPSTQDTRPN